MIVRRRTLLFRSGVAGAVATLGLGAARARTSASARRLVLVNTHTGERLDLEVHAFAAAQAEAHAEGHAKVRAEVRAQIDRLLRDHRTDETHPIDAGVIEQLLALRSALELTTALHVISGYRSPATNARLAAASEGVARSSLHVSGRAIDIRAPAVPLTRLHAAALALKAGGVGYYARSDFVHLDTGRVRFW